MRRRNVKNAYPRLLACDKFIDNPKEYIGKWNEVFGNNNPIHIEIGMGKGKFITELSRRNPNINYIGIEMFDSVLVQAVKKLEDGEYNNLRLICMDARLLGEIFKENEVEKIYLNFSDPWPKARHAKRRLTSPIFLNIYRPILSSKVIEFKTDNESLFTYTKEVIEELHLEVLDYSDDLHADKTDIVTTEYEEKFSSMGNPIHFVKFKI